MLHVNIDEIRRLKAAKTDKSCSEHEERTGCGTKHNAQTEEEGRKLKTNAELNKVSREDGVKCSRKYSLF